MNYTIYYFNEDEQRKWKQSGIAIGRDEYGALEVGFLGSTYRMLSENDFVSNYSNIHNFCERLLIGCSPDVDGIVTCLIENLEEYEKLFEW